MTDGQEFSSHRRRQVNVRIRISRRAFLLGAGRMDWSSGNGRDRLAEGECGADVWVRRESRLAIHDG
jgi:hypothetical protein